MRAAVLEGIKKIRVQDIVKPELRADRVLVQVKAVGVCGSDVHYYLHGKIGDQVVKGPHILGHEAAGLVAEAGSAVKGLVPGMRVAIEPGIPCGICEHCRGGKYNICPEIQFLGTPPISGAYREFMAYPAEFLFPIPDSISYEEAAIIETLVVGMHAVTLSEIKVGDNIAILGCGPVGMVTLKAAIAAGANRIFISDLIQKRLDIATEYKNVIAINASKESAVEKINKETNSRGVDIVFEAAGAAETIAQSIEIARIGGKVVWIGIPKEDKISIDAHIARRKEVEIKTVRRFRHNYKKAIEAVASGKISLKDLITHKFKLEDITKAFGLVENYADGIMKAIIEI